MSTTNSCSSCGGKMTGQLVSVNHLCLECRFILERELEKQLQQRAECCSIISIINHNESKESVNSAVDCHLG
ncbi:hypothetical protein PsalN5692_00125 [Piscirickettsia salmonis]|uniref:hypothetical protein n=1 Tax=Piscirickettsia salmonis TaxID=1238 RepID=UPI0012B9A231|nr:hypothetical protein [Piscirickettsia salmonis]QGP48722.1 hypothetical protein PsalN5692_00125 [Piscirickettsia salmonis]QGP52755.1 hypothetical protein PsalSR1_00143 [Piscirickettsia salmonis]QGP57618.1 hypothetical protein PsalBI1_00153 [Piscirickettsia salmonis]QGP62323.1 hypothetical protein PsalMR5_00143 [Piscirickettsia salmonis]